MLDKQHLKMPWVISIIKNQKFALSSLYVQEMVLVPRIVSVPRAPIEVRGVINLRGRVLPLLDMRRMFGMPAMSDECDAFIELLNAREQDHKNWLGKLDTAVQNHELFTGELDPHKCAFGKWYDAFTTDDLILKGMLKRFDAPHKAIHGVGAKANEFIQNGKFEEAENLVEETRHRELAQLMDVFNKTRDRLRESHFEIAVICKDETRSIAVTVDSVEVVEKLDPDAFDEAPMQELGEHGRLVCGVGRSVGASELIMLIDARRILHGGTVEQLEIESA